MGNDKKENAEPLVSENKEESTIQQVAAAMSAKAALVDDDETSNGTTSFLAIDDMNVRKEDDAKQREGLIKNHFEHKITQLQERVSNNKLFNEVNLNYSSYMNLSDFFISILDIYSCRCQMALLCD